MHTLDRIYAEIGITPSKYRPSRTTLELIDLILKEQGEPGISDWLVDSSPATIPWGDIAEVLAIMIWCTSDNGSRIMRDIEGWLTAGVDERRTFVALSLDVYPFRDPNEMEEVLERVAQSFPHQEELCSTLIASRKQLAEPQR